MDNKPTQRDLIEKCGISQAYASYILAGKREPAIPVALNIFRKTGWKPPVIANLSDEQLDVLATVKGAA